MKDDGNYTNVLLEEIIGQIKALAEITLDTRKLVEPIPQIQEDIAELKADMKTVKHAVTDTNKDLRLVERRVTKLEESA